MYANVIVLTEAEVLELESTSLEDLEKELLGYLIC